MVMAEGLLFCITNNCKESSIHPEISYKSWLIVLQVYRMTAQNAQYRGCDRDYRFQDNIPGVAFHY